MALQPPVDHLSIKWAVATNELQSGFFKPTFVYKKETELLLGFLPYNN